MQTTAELEALRLKMKQMEEQSLKDIQARQEAEKLALELKQREEEERKKREQEEKDRLLKEQENGKNDDFFSSFVTTVSTMSREATETASSMFGSFTE